MFQQVVDRGVAGEAFDEGAAGGGVFLARLEEWFDHLQVRDEVGQCIAGEMLPGPLLPELGCVSL